MSSNGQFLGKFRKQINGSHPSHLDIFKGLILVASFVFLGKLAGAAKEMVIAYRYGVSESVDAYLYIFNLVSVPVTAWLSVISVILIPLATKIRQEKPAQLPRFRAELLALALVVGCDLGLIALLGLPVLLHSSWAGLSGNALNIALDIVPEMAILIPLGVLISLFSVWLQSVGWHANTLLESIPAFAILIVLLVFPQTGVEPLVWGTVIGFFLHTTGLAIPLRKAGEIERPQFTHRSPQWLFFWQGFGVMLFGQVLTSFISVIDQFFAGQLFAGAIATLSYANRLLALLLGLGLTAITRVMLPIFSKISSQNDGQLKSIASFWVWVVFLAGIVAVAVLWWLAPWMVKLLFERGAFSAQDTERVTEVLRYGLIQLPFCFSSRVLNSLYASIGKHKFIVISGGANLFVKAGANFILVPILGINGIIVSTTLMYAVSFFLLYGFMRSSLKQY